MILERQKEKDKKREGGRKEEEMKEGKERGKDGGKERNLLVHLPNTSNNHSSVGLSQKLMWVPHVGGRNSVI